MKKLFKALFSICKGFWTLLHFLRSFFLNLLFWGIILVIIAAVISKDDIQTEPDSILQLTIYGDIVEQKNAITPFTGSINDFFDIAPQSDETLLQDILDCIDAASQDSSITGILLDLRFMGSAGMNQLQDIGTALERFRQSGKKVIAAEDYYNQDQYFLASHADKIFLNPMGFVHLSGFGMYRLYFQEALEKLRINYHVFRVGSYKSALEPFIRNSMSPEDRQQSRSWLNALWASYVKTVSKQRAIDSKQILGYINNIPANLEETEGDLAKLAKENGLVDEIATSWQIRDYLCSISKRLPDGNYRSIHSDDYLKTIEKSYQEFPESDNNIAVIVAQGTILPGPSEPGIIGSETIVELIREAALSPETKAVVLRIDSGGGSAFASELIRQELLELKKKNKPLIISMGRMAASGAYWLSADADEIWASDDTLTGSIGIFMALPTFENMLNHAGIYQDGIGTTNLAGAFDLARPLSPEIKKTLQLSLENNYMKFISIVASGRQLPLETVEKLAQGKVYSGSAALELKLVDKIGSLDRAIAAAAEKAGLIHYDVTLLTPSMTLTEKFFYNFNTKITGNIVEHLPFGRALVELTKKTIIPTATNRRDPQSMYAHCMLDY